MTRASLLRILDHVNGISDDEIRELEQLAAAFPYCQTAHVLLAKTAHDRGSMLAGQRLRRAATYAANRELLRQLLEQRPAVAATLAPAVVPAGVTPPTYTPRTDAAGAATETLLAAPADGAEVLPEPGPAPATDLFAVEVVSVPAPAAEAPPEAAGRVEDETVTPPKAPADAPESEESRAAAPTDAFTEALSAELPAAQTSVNGVASTPAGPEEPAATAIVIAPVQEATLSRVEAAEGETAAHSSAPAETAALVLVAAAGAEAAEELLPAVAPLIRPPSGAGISRFEFGLGEARLPEPTGYRLPDIADDDQGLAAEQDERPTFRAPAPPRVTAPFRADAELGYALSGGSRLGYDLQAHTPDGFTLDLPLEAFFEPDALLLAHARAHQPPPKASSLDLINRFLKAQPRIRAGTAGLPLPAAEQADLSVRSSATAPALASESLAKIMVRQGKTAKAIEIYEHLMAKQPEKMAYFAEQIQQLQQPPE